MNSFVKLTLVKSSEQTKTWRKKQVWYETGKRNECEKRQRRLIEDMTKSKCVKTKIRINLETFKLEGERKTRKDEDWFEYTEDFDGFQQLGEKKIYYNFKFICDRGGAQTRTLRCVYKFVKSQLEIAKRKKLYFVNIIDGDTFTDYVHNFKYLSKKINRDDLIGSIFVGDMKSYNNHINSNKFNQNSWVVFPECDEESDKSK